MFLVIAHQTPLSMGFFRHEYWNGLPSPSPGGLPDSMDRVQVSYVLHWQRSSIALVPPGKPMVIVNWSPIMTTQSLTLICFTIMVSNTPDITLGDFSCDRWYFQYDQLVPLIPFFQCIAKCKELTILNKIFWFKSYFHHDVVVCPWEGYLIWYVVYLIKLLHLIRMFHSFSIQTA